MINKTIGNIRSGFVIAGLLLIVVALPVCGQLPYYEGPTAERGRSESERDLEERVAYQRWLATLAEKNRSVRRDPKLAVAQLQEDFSRIQAVNLEMVKMLSRGGALDYKAVADYTSEIKKRAARLKVNLVLPEPEKRTESPPAELAKTPEQLKRSMLALGKLIYSCVKSPFFKELDVLNQQAAAKVARDLEEIVELSNWIKESGENLKKAAQKQE
jgi:hypothetical protein